MSGAPIEPHDYLYGPKVVQIEDLRVARGKTRRPASSCRHRQLVYDDTERRVWCQDCEQDVDPFDAFTQVCGVFQSAKADIYRRRQNLAEAEAFQIRSRAAKVMDTNPYWVFSKPATTRVTGLSAIQGWHRLAREGHRMPA